MHYTLYIIHCKLRIIHCTLYITHYTLYIRCYTLYITNTHVQDVGWIVDCICVHITWTYKDTAKQKKRAMANLNEAVQTRASTLQWLFVLDRFFQIVKDCSLTLFDNTKLVEPVLEFIMKGTKVQASLLEAFLALPIPSSLWIAADQEQKQITGALFLSTHLHLMIEFIYDWCTEYFHGALLGIMQHSNMQHSKMQHSKMQHCKMQHSKMRHSNMRRLKMQHATQQNATQQNAAQRNATQQHATPQTATQQHATPHAAKCNTAKCCV